MKLGDKVRIIETDHNIGCVEGILNEILPDGFAVEVVGSFVDTTDTHKSVQDQRIVFASRVEPI